jgi:uncharacterized membrane protein YfcA
VDVLNPLYSLSGLAVGVLVGLTGVGGGSLMTPLLVLLFGIHPATAVGTDLLYAAITKSGGVLVHGRNGHVDWRIVGWLALGSLPGAALTLLALGQVGLLASEASHLITSTLGVALVLTAAAILCRRRLAALFSRHPDSPESRRTPALTVLVGAVIGVLVSLSSVGAGAIGVTALVLLYPRLSAVRIVGTDIAHAVPLTLAAGAGHWFLGSVDWGLLVSLLAGSLPGIAIGSHFAAKVSERVLRPVLALVLLVVGGRLLLA